MVTWPLAKALEFQNWISSDPKVDLIIVEGPVEFGLGLANRFRSKLVVFVLSTFMVELLENFGVPMEVHSATWSILGILELQTVFGW